MLLTLLLDEDLDPVIDWNIPNVLKFRSETDAGIVVFINDPTVSDTLTFLATCLHNSTGSFTQYQPGKVYPGFAKSAVKLYGGQIFLENVE